MATPKLANLKNWMTEDEQETLREAAGNLLERSADDFQLAVEALLAAQSRRAAHRALASGSTTT